MIFLLVACGDYSYNPTGTFESPNYPFDYPSDAYCEYVVDLPEAILFSIDFNSFQLDTTRSDILYYGNGTTPDVSQALETLTGQREPDTFDIHGEAIWFIFVSDGTKTFQGFSLTWSATSKMCST